MEIKKLLFNLLSFQKQRRMSCYKEAYVENYNNMFFICTRKNEPGVPHQFEYVLILAELILEPCSVSWGRRDHGFGVKLVPTLLNSYCSADNMQFGRNCSAFNQTESRKFRTNKFLYQDKKSPRGIRPRRFLPSPQGAKYITVTQDFGEPKILCLY